ncbi:MAG TPA: outer membrane beta-barrel protein, partial [Waddliaceae bacterium]
MKKILWIMAFILSIKTLQAYASTCGCEAAFQDGFYGTLSVGADWINADRSGLSSISLVDDIQDPNAFFESWTPPGKTHSTGKVVGNVALGYQLVDARLYLGGQISYTLRSKQNFNLNDMRTFEHISTIGLPPPTTVSGTSMIQGRVTLMPSEFDIDIKPGFLILKNWLLYARAGVAITQLKIKNSGTWTEVDSENGLELQATDSSHHSKNTVGFRVGVGTEYLISQHLGISLD